MKIKDLIDIIEIEKDFDILFIPMRAGQNITNELTIYSTPQGICYWEDAEISFLRNDESCKEQVDKIITFLRDHINELNTNDRELDKFIAVSEILIAINYTKSGKREIDLNKAKDYVKKINRKIVETLNFEDVLGMKDLIDTIKQDKLYKELCFNVYEIHCNKKDRYRGYKKTEKEYHFGNKKYYEDLDIVDITIYDNYVELHHRKEGATEHNKDLNSRQEYTTEGKIITALDCWKCANW